MVKDITVLKRLTRNTANPNIVGSYKVKGSNVYGITDGFRMLEAITPEANKTIRELFNPKNVFEYGYDILAKDENKMIEVEINVDDLNEFIMKRKNEKEYERAPYVIKYNENCLFGINPKFLKDFITITRSNKVLIEKEPYNHFCNNLNNGYYYSISPLSIKGKDYKGVILPISLKEYNFDFIKSCMSK